MTPVRTKSLLLRLIITLVSAGMVRAGDFPVNVSASSGRIGERMVLVPAGEYAPLFRGKDDPERVLVAAFLMDACPVTNAEFLEFVRACPSWRRSSMRRIFADSNYLGYWAGDLELGSAALADAPVVQVSWFAARAYANWRGCRLPTTAEWERAAGVGFTTDNASTEPAVQQLVAAWFARPSDAILPSVGRGQASRLGLYDLHGLVWEWVADFNAALSAGELRADPAAERNLFCGAGSLGARDKSDFAAFLRAAFRSSLRAGYTVPNLGFRCVRSP